MVEHFCCNPRFNPQFLKQRGQRRAGELVLHLRNWLLSRAVVAHAFNPSTQRQRQADLCELEASLVYKNKIQDRHQSYRETLSLKKLEKKKWKSYFSAMWNLLWVLQF